MNYGPYHIETETQYPSFKRAAASVSVLGLNTANCGQHGFVVPTDDPQPDITATQRATKSGKPTENPDGSWSYRWAVNDKSVDEIRDDLPFQSKDEAKAQVLQWADSFLQPLRKGYSASEIDSWPVKGPAAIRYVHNEADSADMLILSAEADALKMIMPDTTVADVAGMINRKAGPYLAALAFTSALRQIVNAQIDQTEDILEIVPIVEAAKNTAADKAAELGLVL